VAEPGFVAAVDFGGTKVAIANMAILLDPERIAVGGGMMGSAERVLAALRRRLERAVPFPPEVVRARFVHDTALRGAVALALDAVAGGTALPALAGLVR
jgi:glucokinase